MPKNEPMKPCIVAKAPGEPAAATSHHTIATVPTEVAIPVSRFMMDSTEVSCGR